jgi:6-aminohexanoate-oligomer endohydrolase
MRINIGHLPALAASAAALAASAAALAAVLLAAPRAASAQSAPVPRSSALHSAARPDETFPVARVSFEGPALTFDFPAVQIGVAEYEEGPTGATVLLFRKPVMAAVDVRGGAPGTVNTDALRLSYDQPFVNAITLAGGSAYGLAFATGVANVLKERTVAPGDWRNVAVVPGAIIFDLGGRRYNAITPDERLARAALDGVRSGWFPLGARGAGRFAMQGGYLGDRQHSGQGAGFRRLGQVKVLVVTVVNALGSIVDRNGRILRCSHPVAGDCGLITERLASHLADLAEAKLGDADAGKHAGPTANTTITVVVTNKALAFWALQRLAVQVHNSMARAIQPFGTEYDGDTLFAVTTGEVTNSGVGTPDLGTLASEAAWDAILASAPEPSAARPRVDVPLTSALINVYAGRYEFAPGVVAEIRRTGAGLEIGVTGQESMYLPTGKWVSLRAVGIDDFEIETPQADRLHVDRDAHGGIAGLTINPGSWPVRARRLPPR